MTLVLNPERTKSAPGPGQTPEALLRALDVSVGRRIHGLVPGDFRAHGRGLGTELAAVRPYQPGDDVRHIDWNATARTTVPHVRERVPERAIDTWLLLDTSPSMSFGTADRRKADVAEGVALAVAHIATRHANRLAVLTFGGRDAVRTAPRGGRLGLLLALRAARAEIATEPIETTTDISAARALRLVASARSRRGLIVVVSDFRGPRDWLRPLAAAAQRHDALCVEIRDPREDELVDVGQLTLVDSETGREVRVDTSSSNLRRRFRDAALAERASLAAELQSTLARHVVLLTSSDWLRSFAAQLRVTGAI
jgi:uncharacterized protein (DUF58 family)